MALLLGLAAGSANACTLNGDWLTEGCPEEISKLSERLLLCVHWGRQESGGDDERAEENRKKWEGEGCNRFQCDANDLLTKNEKNEENKSVVLEIKKNFVESFDIITGTTCPKS